MRSAQVRPLPPGRVEVKRSSLPSGDQRGFELSTPGEVSGIGSPPAAAASQTSECRLFSAATTVVNVNAICLPSGDTAGALTVVTRYQSFGVKARPWAMTVDQEPVTRKNKVPSAAARVLRAKLKIMALILLIDLSGKAVPVHCSLF